MEKKDDNNQGNTSSESKGTISDNVVLKNCISSQEEDLHQQQSQKELQQETLDEEITQECRLFKNVNKGLLPSKLFYFFFFGANGTLLPYLILFFKQIGLSPSQVGVVTGLKPFISFVFSPIWGYLADKTKKTRIIYVVSILAYTGGYFSYSLVPTKRVCHQKRNTSNDQTMSMIHSHIHKRYIDTNNNGDIHVISKRHIFPYLDSYFRRKLSPSKTQKEQEDKSSSDKQVNDIAVYHKYHNIYPAEFGTALFQIPLSYIPMLDYKKKISDVHKKKTSDNHNNGNKSNDGKIPSNTRLTFMKMGKLNTTNFEIENPYFVAKSWKGAVTSKNSPWTVCAAAKANSFEDILLSQDIDKNVSMHAVFSYLLTVTVVATIFSCPLITIVDTATIRKLKETSETHKYGKQRLWGSLGWGFAAFGVGALISLIPLCPGVNNEVNYYPSFYIFAVLLGISLIIGLRLKFNDESGCEVIDIASRTTRIKSGLKLLRDPLYFAFIFTSFYIGVTMSIIKTFLFWHLKDIGGTQMLFSLVSAINCVAEVFIYFVSSTFIKRIGHIRVLYTALVCYSLRLFYYGLLKNPWYVLAAEPLSGITTAAAWAAMTSYVGLNANAESVTTLQGIKNLPTKICIFKTLKVFPRKIRFLIATTRYKIF